MSDDLVKRLRKGDPFGGVMQRAADRIEAMEAENADLSEACAKWAEVSQGNYRRAKDAEADRDALQRAQGYTYIGRNGKAVLARDLEDKIEALEAALIEADALAGAVEFWTIAEELDVSDAIYRLKRTLTDYRQARDATT